MKKLSNVSDLAFTSLKVDIRAIQIRIWSMKEQFKDFESEHLHELAKIIRGMADVVDDWANEKDKEQENN